MERKQYYTVTELANIIGSSRTNVYNQITGRFKPFVKKIDGKLYISDNVLEQFYSIRLSEIETAANADTEPPQQLTFDESLQDLNNNCNQQQKTIDNHSDNYCNQSAETSANAENIKVLKETIAFLKSQLEEKDRQLQQKDTQIEDLLTVVKANNQLLLQNSTAKTLIEQMQNAETNEQAAEETAEPPKKKGFFDFLRKSK